METPICDFVRQYTESKMLRLHMPGHKGSGPLGIENLDITEIRGADSLYEASGIIKRSEENARRLFGCPTYYSAEGSSLCIRAMLYLCVLYARRQGKRPLIAAGRNAHKTLISAAALLDFDLMWLYPDAPDSYLSCQIDPDTLDRQLREMEHKPLAVYLTSPDYLGNMADILSISRICHRHGTMLLVDNAHGAYLKFLPQSQHPIDLGADLCCDSAHKTLPVLTGGAYLHISPKAPPMFCENAKDALAMFASTSPSYLILQSLDEANRYLADGYKRKLADFVSSVKKCRDNLAAFGYSLHGNEPLKLTISTKPWGYDGKTFSRMLESHHIVCEFSDPDFVVMMLTPEIGLAGLEHLEMALLSIPCRMAITEQPPSYHKPDKVMSIREAAFSPSEKIPLGQSLGRIFAAAAIGCPPAVPIVVCGERIDEAALTCLAYYGVETCTVVASDRNP